MLIEHLEKLRHFHRLTDFRSINEAAAKLGVSQAGLSKSLASLERELGVKLFARSKHGLTLTLEGSKALETTKRIFLEAARLESEFNTTQSASTPRRLRIGMYDSIAVYLFGDLRDYLSSTHGAQIELELTVDTSPALSAAMAKKELELAIGVNFDSVALPGCDFFLLFQDEYSFYVSHKLRGDPASLPLLIHPRAEVSKGVTLKTHLESITARNGAFWVSNFETVKALTAEGGGIGVLPTRVARPLSQKGQIILYSGFRHKPYFGRHSIGILASKAMLVKYKEFTTNIYRFGERWSKN
jgi:DNA-binding transcriptional LysR family regulator